MRIVKYSKIIIFVFIFSLLSCQSPAKWRFEAGSGEANQIKVNLVNFGDTNSNGKFLGNLPVDLESVELEGKMLKLSGKGYETQYWIFPENIGETNTVNVNLLPRLENSDETTSSIYKSSLLQLKAYEALMNKKLDLALKVLEESEKNAVLGPSQAILRVLIYLQGEQKEKAIVFAQKAKTLYPNNTEIDELIKAMD